LPGCKGKVPPPPPFPFPTPPHCVIDRILALIPKFNGKWQDQQTTIAELEAANSQLLALEEALQASMTGERDLAQGLQEAAAEVENIRGQLDFVSQVPLAPVSATHFEMFEDV
jgi:hypothetical protein